MDKRIRNGLVAAAAAATLVAPAAPAHAASSNPDCRILGPNYVEEVVDCAIYIITTAIG
jgi:hypothetical protein